MADPMGVPRVPDESRAGWRESPELNAEARLSAPGLDGLLCSVCFLLLNF